MALTDLFEIGDKDSLVRQIIQSKNEIDLTTHNTEAPLESFYKDYTIESIVIDPENHRHDVSTKLKKLREILEINDIELGVQTAAYEAVLNAYEHGNKFDHTKEILIGYQLNPNSFKFFVEDSGGILKPEFASYIMNFRVQNNERIKFKSFYDFSDETPNTEQNQGVGTFFMHQYMDKINYFKGSTGGLIVEMTKNLEKDKNLELNK